MWLASGRCFEQCKKLILDCFEHIPACVCDFETYDSRRFDRESLESILESGKLFGPRNHSITTAPVFNRLARTKPDDLCDWDLL